MKVDDSNDFDDNLPNIIVEEEVEEEEVEEEEEEQDIYIADEVDLDKEDCDDINPYACMTDGTMMFRDDDGQEVDIDSECCIEKGYMWGSKGNKNACLCETPSIPDTYSEPPILTNDGQIYEGEIPDAFKPVLDEEHVIVGGVNLNDPNKVLDTGYGDQWEVIDEIELDTLEAFNIGAGLNQFTIQVRHINDLTYEFTVIQNYTVFYVNGISWIINGEELSSMTNDPIMYQFPNAGSYDIDVQIFGGGQDFDDYSSDPGLQSELILFTLSVDSPGGQYSSGTEEVAFNDYTQYQSGL